MLDRCWLGILALAGLLSLLAGCGGKSGGGTPINDPKLLFKMHCARCHAQAGEEDGPQVGSSQGPSLTRIGSEPGHDAEWIAKFIRDPNSVKANAKMPKFEGAMKDEEIRVLAEYLAGKK